MNLDTETEYLRNDLKRLSGRAEARLARRYGRLPPLERVSAYRRLRKCIGRILRRVGLLPPSPLEPWLPGLKHVDRRIDGTPLVIWALGMDRDTLRTACRGFEKLQATLPDYVPVLVTDVADFAFFSRLGWLVEYLPPLSAPAGAYAERKRRYLAWRYRDAPALPATAGLEETSRIKELLGG